MKRLPALIAFLLAFQIEIRVKAIGHNAVLEVPRGCLLEQTGPCLAQTPSGRPLNLSLKSSSDSSAQMLLAGETLVTRDSFGQYRFEEGAVRVEGDFAKAQPFRLDFLHGKIIASSGAFSVRTQGSLKKEKASGRVWVSNESADLHLVLRSGQTLELPSGFEVWVDGLNSNSQQDIGMIQPWDLKAQLKLINRFSLGSRSRRLVLAAKLKPIAELALVQATQIYQRVAERHIASMEEQDRLRILKDENRRQARLRLKKLYFERTFSR